MRKNFEITEDKLRELLDASKPTPYMCISGGSTGPTPQENANSAWERLGKEMGFKYMTVEPGNKERFFSAEAV